MENRKIEARYRSLLDNSGGGLTITELRDDGISVNLFTSDGMLRLMHTTRAQWNAHHSEDIYAKVHPDDVGKARSVFAELRHNGQTGSAAYRLVCLDGGYTWVNVTGTCAVENGSAYIYAVHTDITQQKESEQKEHAAREQLESILSSITCGICAYEYSESEQDAWIVFANSRYYAMFGYTKEQFEKEVASTLQFVYPDDLPGLTKQIHETFLTGGTQTLDYRCIRRDGEIIWVSINARPTGIFGESRKVMLCETVDITARKRMADEKTAMLDQISFLNQAAGDLLSGTDADSAVEIGLWDILGYFKGQRAYVIELDEERRSSCNTYEVCAPGAEPAKELLQDIPYSSFSIWFDLFERDGFIAISDVLALGEDRAIERELLKVQHISSLIVVPMKENGRVTGMVGVDDPAKNVDQLPRLQAIGDYIAVMLSHRNMTLALQDNNRRMQAMMNDTPGGFVQMAIHADNSITPLFFNDGFCEMLSMTQAQTHALFDMDAYAGAHPGDCARVSALLGDTIEKRSAATTRVRLRTGSGGYIPVEAHYRVWENPDGGLYLNGYYRDISDRLAKEEEYRRNLAYRDVNAKNAIGSYHLNATRNIIDDVVSEEPAIRALGDGGTIDDFLVRCASVQREDDHQTFLSLFSRKALLQSMERGKARITLEHALYPSSEKPLWI